MVISDSRTRQSSTRKFPNENFCHHTSSSLSDDDDDDEEDEEDDDDDDDEDEEDSSLRFLRAIVKR
jgi:TATA-binding protein-associated factor Taf7